MKDPDCELCRLETVTNLYYKCDEFTILDCINCKVPMAVAKDHIDPMDFSNMGLRFRMYEKLVEVAKDFYKDEPRWYIDMQERTIPNHLHWHARIPWERRKHKRKR